MLVLLRRAEIYLRMERLDEARMASKEATNVDFKYWPGHLCYARSIKDDPELGQEAYDSYQLYLDNAPDLNSEQKDVVTAEALVALANRTARLDDVMLTDAEGKDLYEVMGLAPDATDEEIKSSWKILRVSCNPGR